MMYYAIFTILYFIKYYILLGNVAIISHFLSLVRLLFGSMAGLNLMA